MSLREFIRLAEQAGRLTRVDREVDRHLELAAVAADMDGQAVLFRRVRGYDTPVLVGVCSDRELIARSLGVERRELLAALAHALEHPVPPPLVPDAPCQEVVEPRVDLDTIPILTHIPGDGGPYITSGVAIIRDPDLGRNMSFHRLMQIGPNRFAARVVEGRGTATALAKTGGRLDVAICIGVSPAVLLAAAMSPPKGVDELGIAHALSPTPLVRCKTIDLEVPAESEFVLEGRFTGEYAAEGPFIDLTETWDIVRQQPVVEIQCITRRRDPIYHALLPGKSEHKVLMGMPREPTIFAEVSKVAECLDVLITPGGTSWLHAVVQIRKRHEDDGKRAIEAAFRGHGSLKHVVVVDEDVDIHNPADVEWAIATRFQASRDLVVLADQPGSSLDPSACHVPGQKTRTDKMGLDATIPWRDHAGRLRSAEERAEFRRVKYPPTPLR
ncbi:MAG: UbiD family decarboxylase [Anaerolineales bacterium]